MSKTKRIEKAQCGLRGEITIPGDKSISHRSVIFSTISQGDVIIKNFLNAEDCLSTVECMRKLGAKITMCSETELHVQGVGLHGLKEPDSMLDAGNSGTLLRLLIGLLSSQGFFSAFTGDASLHKRPMGRVVNPLTKMGAQIYGREKNTKLPLATLAVQEKLHGITYEMPVASAQVKSALMLAGLFADSPTTVVEPYTSRDHTERMLSAFGAEVKTEGTSVTIYPPKELYAPDEGIIEVPGDISSAAFWLVAASIIEGSDLILKNVGINKTRTGILDVLWDMGADITVLNKHESGGEEIADLRVRSAKLHGTSFGADIMPRLIDEIPIIAVAAMVAEGETRITGAEELRVKETDRLQAIVDQFSKVAEGILGTKDGLIIKGGMKLSDANCFSYDDHRIAMSLAIIGLIGNGMTIENPECVNISYPTFYKTLEMLTGGTI